MNKRTLQILVRWGLVMANMIVIFLFSSQSGENSGELSGFLSAFLNRLPLLGLAFQYINIRKAAHFTIYFLLGIFTFRATMLHVQTKPIQILAALLFCFLYACTDEYHQSFVPGRGPSFGDVMIDTCGALAGIFCITRFK